MVQYGNTNTYMRIETSSRRIVAFYSEGVIRKVDVCSLEDGLCSVEVSTAGEVYRWQNEHIFFVAFLMYGIPVSKDGRFLFAQQNMRGLMCLDATNGNLVWKTKSKAEFSHVLVCDGFLCCSKSRDEIVRIDIASGEVLQAYRTPFDNRFEVLTDQIILNHTRAKEWEVLSVDGFAVLECISDEDLLKDKRALWNCYRIPTEEKGRMKTDMVEALKPYLKDMGFKKIRNYWYLVQEDMTFYLNLQGSCYSAEDYYVNLGVVSAPFQKQIPPIYEWDVNRRCFADEQQINIGLDDILTALVFFLDLFPTKAALSFFVMQQKKKYSHIIVSDRCKLC